jgi:hypothetical protein
MPRLRLTMAWVPGAVAKGAKSAAFNRMSAQVLFVGAMAAGQFIGLW